MPELQYLLSPCLQVKKKFKICKLCNNIFLNYKLNIAFLIISSIKDNQ